MSVLKGDKPEVSRLVSCPDGVHLAAGYMDGSVRIFDHQTGECTVTFTGHKSAITALQYNANGLLLVSGAKVRTNETGTYIYIAGFNGTVVRHNAGRYWVQSSVPATTQKVFNDLMGRGNVTTLFSLTIH